MIEVLTSAPAPDNPLDAAPDESSRALMAAALHASSEVPESSDGRRPLAEQVGGALEALEERYMERRSRELRAAMSDAQRNGDEQMLHRLMQEKIEIDRRRRSKG